MLSSKSRVTCYIGILAMWLGGAEAKSPATRLSAARAAQGASDQRDAAPAVPNAAGVSLQISPEQSVQVGSKISFRVTTRKPGYLLLVDIDATGKMSQIFPSLEMIAQSRDAANNFIKPGDEMQIPNPAAQKRGFEYVVTPPLGAAAIVAILSERRVQILDLPDGAQNPRTEAEAFGELAVWMNGLQVPDPVTGKLQPGNWSFDVKPYEIK